MKDIFEVVLTEMSMENLLINPALGNPYFFTGGKDDQVFVFFLRSKERD